MTESTHLVSFNDGSYKKIRTVDWKHSQWIHYTTERGDIIRVNPRNVNYIQEMAPKVEEESWPTEEDLWTPEYIASGITEEEDPNDDEAFSAERLETKHRASPVDIAPLFTEWFNHPALKKSLQPYNPLTGDPLHSHDIVQVQFYNGDMSIGEAHDFDWKSMLSFNSIVKFRLLDPSLKK